MASMPWAQIVSSSIRESAAGLESVIGSLRNALKRLRNYAKVADKNI
jgi:hypothetical protein